MEGKLGHKKFDFKTFNSQKDGSLIPYACGYAGCALGECPIVFPKKWKFGFGGPVLIEADIGIDGPSDSAEDFFGINWDECKHLFFPEEQNPQLYGGQRLGSKAKRQAVARNILAFLEVKGKK